MKLAELVQVVSFEVNTGCNLIGLHPACPCSLGEARYADLPRDQRLSEGHILDFMDRFYADGYRGWVSFSYYNEPLQVLPTVLRLRSVLSLIAPRVRFWLITNGTLLPDDLTVFKGFHRLDVTDYGPPHSPDPARLEELRKVVGASQWPRGGHPAGLWVNKARLDRRIEGLGADRSEKPCFLPFKDFTVDAFGNVHLCCFDWRGGAKVGNIITDGLPAIEARWLEIVRALTGERMDEDAPESCRRCRYTGNQRFDRLDPMASLRAQAWVEERRANGRH